MKKLFLLFLMLIIILIGCSNQSGEEAGRDSNPNKDPEPVQEEDIQNLTIGDYFPTEPGTIREYKTFNEQGEIITKEYEVINSLGSTKFISPDQLGEFVIVRSSDVYEPDLTVEESRDFYDLKDNKLIRLTGENNNDLQKPENEEIQLTNELAWQMTPAITRTITGVDKTISTEAGEFSNCIETTDTSVEDDSYQLKSYYAPGKGLVLSKKLTKADGEFTTTKEMINFQLPTEEADPVNEEEPPETETAEETETPIRTFVHHNEKYGFYLDLPLNWKGHYLVEETQTETGATSLNFRFKSDKNLYIDTIMNILVSDKTKEEIQQENADSGFPVTYLTTQDGNSYSYLYNVGDPSIELINSEQDLNLLIELKQQVPEAMETMRFHP